MARTPKRLAGPAQVTNSAATKYTVPGATTTVVRSIHVQNPSGSPVDFTMSIGTDVDYARIYDGLAIPADSERTFWCYHVLEAGEILQAFAGTNNILTLTINGDEIA